MNVLEFLKKYADSVGGQYTDYDHAKAVVVLPLKNTRFQTVLCTTQKSPSSGRSQILFTSKVCPLNAEVNLAELLSKNADFDFGKFIIEDGYIKIEASCLSTSTSEEQVKEMVWEVAEQADTFEMHLTGQDVH